MRKSFVSTCKLDLTKALVPSHGIQDLVEALTDENKLTRLLDALDDQQFEATLVRLADFESDFPAEAVPIAVPVLVNRMKKLSPHSDGMFGVPPRFKITRLVLRLLRRIENPDDLMAITSSILGKVDSLSGWFELVEMVGHRESIGHELVNEDQAQKLEDQFVDRLKSATAEQLVCEWDLFVLSLRTVNWHEGEDKTRLVKRLREHLVVEEFVLTLLCTAVNYAQYNGHTDKRLSWDSLVEVFGEGLTDAVDRLARSPMCQNLPEDDQDTINLAQKYASGWRPEEWPAR